MLPRDLAWDAILAGVLLTFVVEFMLSLLGLGLKLTVTPFGQETSSVVSLLSVSGLWAMVAALVGLGCGGFAAARFAGVRGRGDALLCGVITFSSVLVTVLFLLTQNGSALAREGFRAVDNAMVAISEAGHAPVQTGNLPGPSGVQPAIESEIASLAGAEASEASVTVILRGLAERASREERNRAITELAAASGLTEELAARRLAEWQQANDRALRRARRAADAAAGDLAKGAFMSFVALACGLLAALGGSLAGRATTPIVVAQRR